MTTEFIGAVNDKMDHLLSAYDKDHLIATIQALISRIERLEEIVNELQRSSTGAA